MALAMAATVAPSMIMLTSVSSRQDSSRYVTGSSIYRNASASDSPTISYKSVQATQFDNVKDNVKDYVNS